MFTAQVIQKGGPTRGPPFACQSVRLVYLDIPVFYREQRRVQPAIGAMQLSKCLIDEEESRGLIRSTLLSLSIVCHRPREVRPRRGDVALSRSCREERGVTDRRKADDIAMDELLDIAVEPEN